jgi:two-component system response regulator HydG
MLSRQADFGELIGESAPMHRLYELIERVGRSTCPVLLLGETGTGKELTARSVHLKGPRRGKVFVPVDCSALTPSLVEGELFGHVKGAFTGADRSKTGLFEAAHEGTIFLDEVGELPLLLQAKLLRALQEKEIRPVGSTERIPINVRVIAATNRDLEKEVRAGTFRQDLFYRLNVLQIKLPTLRERKFDIPILVAHFLQKFSDPLMPIKSISDDALHRLLAYDWPGNVRELQNAVERALALSSGNTLTLDDFASLPSPGSSNGTHHTDELVPLAEMERRTILLALQQTGGDKPTASRLLGIGRTTLYRKLRKYSRNLSGI